MKPLLSKLRFGSYLVYSPGGQSEISKKSRRFRDAVKSGREPTLQNIIDHLKRNFERSGLGAVLGPDVTLVPCPRSSLLVEGALWPAKIISEKLVAEGLGSQVLHSLERIEAVPKSAFQARGERPNALTHYKTIRATGNLVAGERITLVDDFVTKGNTLLGAASRLAEVYPGADISAFAPVRTRGLQPEINTLVDAHIGQIVEHGSGDANRDD